MLKPWLLLLEVTNRCNGQCVYCPKRYDILDPCDMELDLYKRIINNCPDAREVHPQMVGEPLLYPQIIEAISYAKMRGKTVRVYTNASFLDGDMAERLLETRVDEIRFSVDGCDKESYESLRAGLSWKTVLSNIENFQRLKEKKGHGTNTTIRICVTDQNRPILNDIKDFWRKRVDGIMAEGELYIPTPQELLKERLSSKRPVNCVRPFEHLSVKSNGDLVLCCGDYYCSYVMANLYEADPLEAYNNDKFNQVRKAMREGINHPSLCSSFCGRPR